MPRQSQPLDLEPFAEVMAEALWAFGEDLEYATATARRAVMIAVKRECRDARSYVRKAVVDARLACESGPAFACRSDLPCGVGPACRYADPELVGITENEELGKARGGKLEERPQHRPDGTVSMFNSETVVYAARDLFRDHSGAASASPGDWDG